MDSEFYREFITIVETKNFAEAADLLSMSTSAISRHLKAVEDELGVELFTRTSRTVQLNEYGELFLPYAQRMVQEQTEFLYKLGKHIEQQKNTIHYTGNYQFNSFLAKFRRKNPQYSIVKSPRKGFSLQHVLEGKCDLAIFHRPEGTVLEGEKELETLHLGDDRLIVAVPGDSPFAARSSIDLKELKNHPIIAIISNDTDKPFVAEYVAAGYYPKIALTVSSGEEALALVSEGLGATIMMHHLAERANIENVRLLEIEGMVPEALYAGRLKDHTPTPAADALWNYLAELHIH